MNVDFIGGNHVGVTPDCRIGTSVAKAAANDVEPCRLKAFGGLRKALNTRDFESSMSTQLSWSIEAPPSHFARAQPDANYQTGLAAWQFLLTDLPDRHPPRIPVQPLQQKYFAFSEAQIRRMVRASRFLQEGRLAIVTDVGSGMRWTRGQRKTSAPHAYGEVVWS